MAIYTLGSESYKKLEYPEEIWKSRIDISYLLSDLWPVLDRVSSKFENELYCWFFGKIVVSGQGTVRVVYPYSSNVESSILTPRNINLAEIPYLKIVAKGTGTFQGWFDEHGNKLQGEPDLFLSQWSFPEVTTFYARFEE